VSTEERAKVIADIELQAKRTSITVSQLLSWYDISRSTYYDWKKSTGSYEPKLRQNYYRLRPEEINNILEFRGQHPNVGYRKLTWMLNDAGVAFVSESAVYQVLSKHGMLYGFKSADNRDTKKEYENKPRHPHHHWHTDIAYIKIKGIFYFLIMVLDGYSRYLLDWELMTDMLGSSVEDFIQRVKDKYPFAKPMLIHDNGSQFISNDFKKLVTRLDIQQVFTRRNHPQTNGKIERMNGTVKNEAIRPGAPDSYAEAWEILNQYAYFYNHQRLHAGIKYLRPADVFFGRAGDVLQARRKNVVAARTKRFKLNKMEAQVAH
jgi:transposase InsO family protein